MLCCSVMCARKAGATLDFLPQSFFVGLFSALRASLLTLKRLRTGAVSPSNEPSLPLPKSLPARILCFTFGSLIIFGGGAVLILAAVNPLNLTFATALILKAFYGILITVAITPVAIRAVLFNASLAKV